MAAATSPMLLTVLAGCACAAWVAVLLLPSQPHRVRERLEPSAGSASPRTLGAVTVLIPARNEADVVGRTLAALAAQGDGRVRGAPDVGRRHGEAAHEPADVAQRDGEAAHGAADVAQRDGEAAHGAADVAQRDRREAYSDDGLGLHVVVVDDRSSDGTGEICRAAASAWARGGGGPGHATLEVVTGVEPPPGWSGKLWALEQGLGRLQRRYTLLLDADIELAPGMVAALVARAGERGAALVSVMATLRCTSGWERLLVPPFVYFFKLIYPFARVSSARAATAAAAGGCILIETRVLREAGFSEIRGALIDDCALARSVKRRGFGLWLGLSRSVRSLRPYPRFADFALMVRRTAFTQLGYRAWLLLGVTLVMLLVFAVPFAGLAAAPTRAGMLLGLGAAAAMYASYVPIARFYGLGPAWIVTLPVAAALYVWMTWGSALQYWRGTTAEWKNRAYVAEHE